jgi:preprotein translocase subunit SecA
MILKMVESEIEQVVSFHTNGEDRGSWDLKELCATVSTIFPLHEEEKLLIQGFAEHGESKLESVEQRTKLIEHISNLAIKKYQEIVVQKATFPELVLELERQVLLRSMDNLWIDHLVAVDYLRTGIGLRGYGQRDPLVEYKKETYRMFNELLSAIQKEVVYSVYKITVGTELPPSVVEKGNLNFQGAEKTMVTDMPIKSDKPTNSDGKEIGRNDLCFCGSGKKYKKCHGA